MTAEANVKLNMSFPEATEYRLLPLAFFGKGKDDENNSFARPGGKAFARAQIQILSDIYTSLKNFGKKAKITKSRLCRKCGLAKSTVKYGIEKLKAYNVIEEVEKDVYKIIPKINGKRYIVLDNYLNTKKFNVKGNIKELTSTSEMVLAYIKSFYMQTRTNTETGEREYINYDFKSRKVINYFRGSEISIATALNLPKSTVSYAILELVRAGLLYRNKQLRYKDENDNVRYKTVHKRGVTGNTLSLFAVKYEVLAVEQRSVYEPQKIEFIEDLERTQEIEVTESEIEAEYAALRAKAEMSARAAREKATNDKEFCKLQSALMRASNRVELNMIAPKYLKRLSELGLTEEELNPIYQCSLCNDTGRNYDTGQRCVCRSRIKQSIINRKIKA